MRLGLELPPLVAPPGGRAPVAEWLEAAAAAEGAGFEAVWVAGPGCDPCTLAGALVALTQRIRVGVVAGAGPSDRNPSVLARDVTALDLLSPGRAAVLVEGGPGVAAEAAEVCRLLFLPGPSAFEGTHFRLVGAPNLPPPTAPPPVLVQSPVVPPGGAADGWVVTGGPAEVAAWRARAEGTALVWRGDLGADAARRADALFAAGADGLIVTVAASAEAVVAVGRQLG